MNVAGFFWLQQVLQTLAASRRMICFFFVLVVCGYQGARIAFLGWLLTAARAPR